MSARVSVRVRMRVRTRVREAEALRPRLRRTEAEDWGNRGGEDQGSSRTCLFTANLYASQLRCHSNQMAANALELRLFHHHFNPNGYIRALTCDLAQTRCYRVSILFSVIVSVRVFIFRIISLARSILIILRIIKVTRGPDGHLLALYRCLWVERFKRSLLDAHGDDDGDIDGDRNRDEMVVITTTTTTMVMVIVMVMMTTSFMVVMVVVVMIG